MASRKPVQKKKDKRATVVFFTAVAVLLLALVLLLIFVVFRPAGDKAQTAVLSPSPTASAAPTRMAPTMRGSLTCTTTL